MIKRTARSLSVAFACIILGGCGIGYNSVLFVTKSNVGLDIDTKPPTAQISIARLEGVFAPSFEGGQTPPIMASFRSEEKGLLGVFFSVSSTFAGGDAAATLAKKDATSPALSTLCLTVKPKSKYVLWHELKLPDPGDVRPFIFGTDTSFGLKVAWSGLTAQFPDTVRLGYQRKEMSWAPVSLMEKACGPPSDPARYTVKVPSFIATIDISATVKEPQKSGYTWIQNFATGESATSLALREDVRKIMQERLDPETVVITHYGPDENTPCIKKWIDADKANRKRLHDWMVANKVSGRPTDLVDGDRYAGDRAKAVKDLGIQVPCN